MAERRRRRRNSANSDSEHSEEETAKSSKLVSTRVARESECVCGVVFCFDFSRMILYCFNVSLVYLFCPQIGTISSTVRHLQTFHEALAARLGGGPGWAWPCEYSAARALLPVGHELCPHMIPSSVLVFRW